jgi:hypothetical protein
MSLTLAHTHLATSACIRISEEPDQGLKKDGSVSAEKEPCPRNRLYLIQYLWFKSSSIGDQINPLLLAVQRSLPLSFALSCLDMSGL